MNKVKTINGLMKYLRETHNVIIEGSNSKQKLMSIGYFHGYKGYRYIKNPNNKLIFSEFNELLAIIEFDNKLKSLLYPQIMFIETAIKSYILETIIQETNSESFSEIYSKLMIGYKEFKKEPEGYKYKKAYKKRLDTFNKIQNSIAKAYESNNNIITHYFKKDESVPIWAIFEILTLGEFGNLISTFDIKIRKKISKTLSLNIAFDSKGNLIESIIFSIKDLRNAIAHNNIIFDTRFNNRNINNIVTKVVKDSTKLSDINFKGITDYLIFIVYILKKLKKTNKEIQKLLNDYIKIIENLKSSVPNNIFDQIILTNDIKKVINLKNNLKIIK